QLLDEDGRIYRLPLIEPVPAYRSTHQSFGQAAPSLLSGWNPEMVAEVVEFVSLGLFPPELLLHQHQYDVFREVVANGHDAVVTTGTGSGKTESFMLPIVAAIIRESAQWAAAGVHPAQWDWWNPAYITTQGTTQSAAGRVPQRSHETRAAGVR